MFFVFGGREWNVHYQNFTLGGIAMKRPPNSHSHYLGGGEGLISPDGIFAFQKCLDIFEREFDNGKILHTRKLCNRKSRNVMT